MKSVDRYKTVAWCLLLFVVTLLPACGNKTQSAEGSTSTGQAEDSTRDTAANDDETVPPPFTGEVSPIEPPYGAELPVALVGKWQTTALTITLNQPFAEGREQLERVHRGDFQTSIARQKIHTLLQANGVFYIETYDLQNTLVARQAGRWYVQNGALVLEQTHPHVRTFTFTYALADGKLTVRGTIDALGEGTYRDAYQATWTKR
jgi:hypothetical protein